MPSIPMGGSAPAPTAQGTSLWPDVKVGTGERPRPTWRPLFQPALGLHGIGFLLGTRGNGQPHLERIAAWAEAAVAQGKPLPLADGTVVIAAYLRSKARQADHIAWLKASLQATRILPRLEEEEAVAANEAERLAPMLAETHEGWMRTAPRHVEILLAEAQAGRAA